MENCTDSKTVECDGAVCDTSSLLSLCVPFTSELGIHCPIHTAEYADYFDDKPSVFSQIYHQDLYMPTTMLISSYFKA